ncbi:MAG TPA: glutamate 5-kinase [Gammaproteobacteria bacterium]|nr:glutamate 5-kinase [Gammaproteobacteria bacterium]
MKIVVKVGTQSILSEQGIPQEAVLSSIVEQLVDLQNNKCQVVLVSSGAVGFGRSVSRQMLGKEYGSDIGEKQVLASLGQHELMRVYANMFKKHNMLVSQLLLTKQDFHTRMHYLNIARLITKILEQRKIIPIINENDSVSIEQLMFTDNDELAGLIAAQIDADKLIILSNIAGVYTGHPNEPDSKLIPVIDPALHWPSISTSKSTHGRGGMISKLSTARKVAKLGIMTHIASIDEPNIVKRIVNNDTVGTVVLAEKKQSNIKRWIAYSTGQKRGEITVNKCLHDILQEHRRTISLLPVGIEKCTGNFEKGDIVGILSPDKELIGIGIAKYNAVKLQELLGQKNQPVFIHYDHLHIF